LGDSRSGYNDHRRVAAAVLASAPDIYVNSGDLVCSGEDQVCWQEHFDIERELMATRPLLPAIGNHDTDGLNVDNYKQYLVLPKQFAEGDPNNENFYFYDWGNTRFIVLDDQIASQAIGGVQYEWLVQTLEEARRDPEILHVIVMSHVGPYTAKPGRSGNHNLRSIVDMLRSYDVTVVFSGHDHHFYRGQAANGLNFIVTGGGGASLYECEPRADYGVVSHACDQEYHYIVFDVDGRRIHGAARDVDGTLIDEWDWESPKESPSGDLVSAAEDARDDTAGPGVGTPDAGGTRGTALVYDPKYGFSGCTVGLPGSRVGPMLLLAALTILQWRRRARPPAGGARS
jgi:hypothetical protein